MCKEKQTEPPQVSMTNGTHFDQPLTLIFGQNR